MANEAPDPYNKEKIENYVTKEISNQLENYVTNSYLTSRYISEETLNEAIEIKVSDIKNEYETKNFIDKRTLQNERFSLNAYIRNSDKSIGALKHLATLMTGFSVFLVLLIFIHMITIESPKAISYKTIEKVSDTPRTIDNLVDSSSINTTEAFQATDFNSVEYLKRLFNNNFTIHYIAIGVIIALLLFLLWVIASRINSLNNISRERIDYNHLSNENIEKISQRIARQEINNSCNSASK